MTELLSLDQIDRESFAPAPSPMSGAARSIALRPGGLEHPVGPPNLSLNGGWRMAEGGAANERLSGAWNDAIPAAVPGSIQTALLNAGRIPDPYIGRNDEIARAESFKTWWLKKTFERPAAGAGERLVFGGICDACAIWLNGEKLGERKGMFAELTYDVASLLVDGENTLIVRLDPAPERIGSGEPNDFFIGMNVGWLNSAVINNIYGWHYINLPTLGIWRPVSLKASPAVEIIDPFIATMDAQAGLLRLRLTLKGENAGWRGRLIGSIEPENFEGEAHGFASDLESSTGETTELLEFTVPDAQPWWPVDHGDPNLYRLRLSFLPDLGAPDHSTLTFGIRTIEMRPTPDGPNPEHYNWTFVVNGKPIFVKGANWCTLDALLRFEPERYERFLQLAKDSHMQLLRAWGSGMPETDEFYDLADRHGIMVMQEWPTAWNSHRIQPYDILDETVRHNTIRLRNHPSLVMWGGGNESSEPFGEAIDMMGRHSYELDGTRPFHRGEPWGGSIHSYHVFWQYHPLDYNLSLSATFIGEFGLASPPNYETVERYLPAEELDAWPPASDSAFTHHMPVFNLKAEQTIMAQYVADFLPADSLKNFILGMQMAQATGMRHTLELARARWPGATGVCYYKLTDNNPAASWATVDWHGVPKIAYHVLRGAYRPLHVCLLFKRLSCVGAPASFPVVLLDDRGDLDKQDWTVNLRAFDSDLKPIKRETFHGSGEQGQVARLGELALDTGQTWSCPLFITADISTDSGRQDSVFYWLNYAQAQGSLFRLPRTQLAIKAIDASTAAISNIGHLPAVGVHFDCPEISHHFDCADSYFWLDAGEERRIAVSQAEGIGVAAWNAAAVRL
ncbi:MAG: beta-mannosidase [Chloroflexota bacterium]|nr:beta-mannosidase [Chloroflexota bacterium]MDE2908499.1 beta-mannosidase [Chloroflexota bacterium]